MPANCISTSDEAQLGARGPSEIKDCSELPDDIDKLQAGKYHHQLQDLVVQKALQHIKVARIHIVQGLDSLKKAIAMLKATFHTEQATNANPRRRGMYTFLYGGRVNPDTFYDYKDNIRRGRF